MESFTIILTEQLNASSDQLYVSLEATNPWFLCRETPTSDAISQLLREGECYIKWVIYFLWTALSNWRGVKKLILAKGKDKHYRGVCRFRACVWTCVDVESGPAISEQSRVVFSGL